MSVWSSDAETTRRPSGVTAHACHPAGVAFEVASARPLSRSQTFSVWSADAETTRRPSGVTAHALHPVGVAFEGGEHAPALEVPDLERLVSDAETTRRPSGVTAHALTQSVWPSSVASARPLSRSQTLSVWSSDAETTRRPSGVTAHAFTAAGVAFEGGERAPALEVPDLQRPVIRRRDHAPAVRRHRARGHPVGVAFEGGERAPARRGPRPSASGHPTPRPRAGRPASPRTRVTRSVWPTRSRTSAGLSRVPRVARAGSSASAGTRSCSSRSSALHPDRRSRFHTSAAVASGASRSQCDSRPSARARSSKRRPMRLVAARAAALGHPRHVGLGLVHAQLATLRLQEAHVGGEPPRVRPVARLGAMDQRMAQGVPPRRRIRGSRPGRELLRQRARDAPRSATAPIASAMCARIESWCSRYSALPVRAPGLDEQLARTAHERPSLRLAGPAGHGAELVERERLARGAQDPEAVHDDGIDRDPLPRLRDQRREAARDVLDATLLRAAAPARCFRSVTACCRLPPARATASSTNRASSPSGPALPAPRTRARSRRCRPRSSAIVEIDLHQLAVARLERSTRTDGAAGSRTGRSRRAAAHAAGTPRADRRQRSRGRIVLVEAVDQHDQPLAARHQLALARRAPASRPAAPPDASARRPPARAASGNRVLDLRHQRADQLRRIVPVVLASADEVMRHHGAGCLAPRQPRREHRALAHPRPAGHHDPAIGPVRRSAADRAGPAARRGRRTPRVAAALP